MRQHYIMPPLMAPTLPWREPIATADAEELPLEYVDPQHLAAVITEAQQVGSTRELDWSNPDDRREMRREHRKIRAAEKRIERRAEIAANQRAFSGRAEIGRALTAMISGGKPVVTTHRHEALRTTFSGTLTCGEHAYRGHFVVLMDRRAEPGHQCAEIVWTGKDWRVHIWRASRENQQVPVVMDIAR